MELRHYLTKRLAKPLRRFRQRSRLLFVVVVVVRSWVGRLLALSFCWCLRGLRDRVAGQTCACVCVTSGFISRIRHSSPGRRLVSVSSLMARTKQPAHQPTPAANHCVALNAVHVVVGCWERACGLLIDQPTTSPTRRDNESIHMSIAATNERTNYH